MTLAPENPTIRVATEADLPILRDLIERSCRVLQANDYTPAQLDGALGHALGVDTQLIRDRTYFVAEIDQKTVACGGWSFRKTLFGSDGGPDRIPEPLDPKTDAAKIRAIFVHPDNARQGLGSLVLKHCEDAAAAAGFTRLEMGSTLTGVPLYRLRGYVEVQQVNVPLPNREVLPVIKMVKHL
ncbi:MAG TPA: GNAT family N-acetyltransferase [Candidatus Koribacter sp.]|jgi:GNAT superfamily N-acetyltransferase